MPPPTPAGGTRAPQRRPGPTPRAGGSLAQPRPGPSLPPAAAPSAARTPPAHPRDRVPAGPLGASAPPLPFPSLPRAAPGRGGLTAGRGRGRGRGPALGMRRPRRPLQLCRDAAPFAAAAAAVRGGGRHVTAERALPAGPPSLRSPATRGSGPRPQPPRAQQVPGRRGPLAQVGKLRTGEGGDWLRVTRLDWPGPAAASAPACARGRETSSGPVGETGKVGETPQAPWAPGRGAGRAGRGS